VSRLLKSAQVQQYLAEEYRRLRGRLTVDQDRHAQEICDVAYSDLRDVCSWGPDGVVLKPSDAVPEHAARAVQSIKCTTKTRLIPLDDGTLVPATETRAHVTLHPKVPALSLLQTMFERGQAVQQHLEGKLREIAGIAAKYVPSEDHAQYLAEVRLALGDEAPSVPEPEAPSA
jgi:hypothetical protein